MEFPYNYDNEEDLLSWSNDVDGCYGYDTSYDVTMLNGEEYNDVTYGDMTLCYDAMTGYEVYGDMTSCYMNGYDVTGYDMTSYTGWDWLVHICVCDIAITGLPDCR